MTPRSRRRAHFIQGEQIAVLAFVTAQLKGTGIAPSLGEIAVQIGSTSKAHVQRLLDDLVWDGKLVRMPNRARGLALAVTNANHHRDCACDECSATRYAQQLALVDAISIPAPISLRRFVHTGHATNFVVSRFATDPGPKARKVSA